MDKQNVPNVPPEAPTDPYNDMEFEGFLNEIGNHNLKNWTILAEVYKVSRRTIYRWRQHPMAKQAINSAIEESLRLMRSVGASDWKMYREELKMYGVKDKTTTEVEIAEGEVFDVIDRIKNDDLTRRIKESVVETSEPVQNQGQTGSDSNV